MVFSLIISYIIGTLQFCLVTNSDFIKGITVCVVPFIILDIIMPIIDGIGVMQKIKESNLDKKPEIMILSGVSQEKMTKEDIMTFIKKG